MPKEDLTIAYYQQDIAWEDPEANYRRVAAALDDLGGRPDVIVVPETFSTGFSDNMAAMAEPPEGPTFRFALDTARSRNALFVGTWTVRVGDAVFNRLHAVRPDGGCVCYDKAHTFRMSSEASQLAHGCRNALIEWQGWRIRPAICYDLRFPKWLRNSLPGIECPHSRFDGLALGQLPDPDALELEYDLLVVCANWPGSRHEAWSTLLRARAIENLCYVAGVNRVGTDGTGIPYSGDCAVIDFRGRALDECLPGAPMIRTATLSRTALRTFRRHWPFYLDFD